MISDNARVDFSEKLANLFEERLKMLENKFPVDVQEVESLKYLFFDTCVYSCNYD